MSFIKKHISVRLLYLIVFLAVVIAGICGAYYLFPSRLDTERSLADSVWTKLGKNKHEEALTLLDEYIADNDPSPKLLLMRAGIKTQYSKDYPGAIEDLDKAIAADPNPAPIYAAKSTILLFMNSMQDALRAIDKAIELKPEMAGYYAQKAGLLAMHGEKIDALASIDHALEIEPDNKKYIRLQEGIKALK